MSSDEGSLQAIHVNTETLDMRLSSNCAGSMV